MADTSPDRFILSRGIRIPKAPILNAAAVRPSLRRDSYERKELDAIERVVRRHDRVLELGAGIGFVSSYLCACKQVRHVTSFEANPSLIAFIKRVHAANDATQATVHNALVTPTGGAPLPFYIRENFLASSLDREADPDSIIDTVAVPQRAVADVLDEVKPTVLICDIEGAEADLLPAADWSALRLAIVELHPQWIGQTGVRAVFDSMHKAGLTYFPKASDAKVVTFRKDW